MVTTIKNLKAIILAAGFGTRLGDLGEQSPKGLIQARGVPLVSRVIQGLEELQIQNIALVTNQKYYQLYQQWSHNQASSITIINDGADIPTRRLGALGDLKLTLTQTGWINDPVIIAPSDTYFTFPLNEFIHTIEQSPYEFATIVREMNPDLIKNRLGCAVLSTDHLISQFIEKPANPPSPYAAIPFYYLPPHFISQLNQYEAEKNSMDAPGNIIPWLIQKHSPVHACIVTHQTIDVGTQEDVHFLQSI